MKDDFLSQLDALLPQDNPWRKSFESLISQEPPVAFTQPVDEEVPEGLNYKKDGTLEKTNKNLTTLIEGYDAKLRGLFKYNEANGEVEITRNQKLTSNHSIKAGTLSDTSIRQLWAYLSKHWGVDWKKDDIVTAVMATADTNSYHPIKIFLEVAKVKARDVDPFEVIKKYINVEDNEYNRLVFDLMLRGAIARIYRPGCQFDYCLDLVGKQATRKTTFLRELFKGYYGEVADYTSKDEQLKMSGLWCVNDDELVATQEANNSRGAGINKMKRIITMREIRIRRPYARSIEVIPVDFIFTRTTNNMGHLMDLTGNRRFLPVEVFAKKGDWEHISKQDRYDIWGNYFKSYDINRKLYYDENSNEGKLIAKVREEHIAQDEIIEKLEWYLDSEIPEDFYSPGASLEDRQNYYQELYERGVANTYRSEGGRIEWKGAYLKRDRLSPSMVCDEIFPDERYRKTNILKKIRMYMDNQETWEKRKSIRFGKKIIRGYCKV